MLLPTIHAGWCFWNEAHVAALDGDYRDFGHLHEISSHCPQVCCMTATLQPGLLPILADKLGRPEGFSESMFLSPKRSNLSLELRMSVDPRMWITQELSKLTAQKSGQRAIVFCMFKKQVYELAELLRSKLKNFDVFECVAGSNADLTAFKMSLSGIMVCTTVLAAGVSFQNVTRVFFLDCAHGPELFLQGAGRGARSDSDHCTSTLVTNKSQLQHFKGGQMANTAEFAAFCLNCIENNLVFAQEIYALYDHQTVHVRASKRARSDDESSALASQTDTSAKSVGHPQQQPLSQQQQMPQVCYENMCYVIVVLHIHCFLPHSVCGTVPGRLYSCPKQCICPILWAPTTTTAFTAAADTTCVLREYMLRNCCAAYA
jgi:superfamily II DNA/RNA helicase